MDLSITACTLLCACVATLRAALPSAVKLHDAMKANPMPALVVVFQSRACGASASPQAFLGHPPCIEVLV